MGIKRTGRNIVLAAFTFGVLVALPVSSLAQPNNYGANPGATADPGAQADWAQPDQDQMGVNMTLYHVVTGANGQELMMTPGGQATPLPGAGVIGHRVAVYHGSHGGTWYVDRNGNQVDLPAMEPGFYSNATAGGGAYAPVPPYYGPYGGNGYQNYYPPAEQQQQPPTATASATVNTTGGGSGGGGIGGFAGGLIGSALGTAVGDLAGGGLPYGAPVYYGGGGPYYYGGGGNRVFVRNTDVNNTHFNEWHNQQNWYHNQFNNGGRYNHQSWAGKDHGFPAPWEGNNGRLYGRHDGADGGRRDGGDGRHDGGEGRHDGGEGRHDGGAGEHHAGGGGHRGGGGGGHHGGGGHRR
jgi:hypothetical protein